MSTAACPRHLWHNTLTNPRNTDMTEPQASTEERILRMMKRVLTDVAKDTFTRPGHRHPLSDSTIDGIRQCLALISARECELNEAAGRPMTDRPQFSDEPQSSVVVTLDVPDSRKPDSQ
jgi:hypothetical protein